MEIEECVDRLHLAFEKGDSSLGCVSRASLLSCFMKNKGLKPQIKQFYFTGKDGKKISSTHCVVLCNGNIYDTNLSASENPVSLGDYEEMIKKSDRHLVWVDLNRANNPIDFVWHYLCKGCDEELQKEIKPLMQEEYEAYLEKYPHVRDLNDEDYGEPSWIFFIFSNSFTTAILMKLDTEI